MKHLFSVSLFAEYLPLWQTVPRAAAKKKSRPFHKSFAGFGDGA